MLIPFLLIHFRSGCKALLQIPDDIVNVFGSDGQTDRILIDACRFQLLRRHLRMSRVVRMDHQALDVRHIRQEGEDLQTIDERVCFLLAAFDAEGEDGRSAVREILLVQRVIRMIREGGMTDLLHLRMGCQELNYLLRAFGSVNCGNLPDAAQSNLPPSTISPPRVVP